MNIKSLKLNRGFTLVEFIIYFAVTTSILTILVLAFINLMESRENSKARLEISTYGKYIAEQIIREIENAYEIIDPVSGNSDEILIRTSEIIENPPGNFTQNNKKFYLSPENKIILEEFENSTSLNSYSLTPNTFKIFNLDFERLNNYQIVVSFTVQYVGYAAYDKLNEEKFRFTVNNLMSI